MSRYIDAEALKEKYTMVIKQYSGGIMECPALLLETIDDAPHIDLDDYVPRDFHDKTCEAMAKRHQEEIADMVSVVRCKKCKYEGRCRKAVEHITHEPTSITIGCKAVEFCSYGEREAQTEWNIFSTIIDDFLFDEFICLDALKARLLYERFKQLTEDIDSLLTDRPKVNVMTCEEAVERIRKTEQTEREGE